MKQLSGSGRNASNMARKDERRALGLDPLDKADISLNLDEKEAPCTNAVFEKFEKSGKVGQGKEVTEKEQENNRSFRPSVAIRYASRALQSQEGRYSTTAAEEKHQTQKCALRNNTGGNL